MSKSILITDDLFIFAEHEMRLVECGFEPVRFKGTATEDELCEAVKGKHGYILGGIERVTPRVIDSADVLEAIAFTGSGYTEYITGHQKATERGIAISAATGANALDVAEFTIGTIIEMVRNFPLLRSPGGGKFYTARRLHGLTLGVIGCGHIGREVVRLAIALGMKVLVSSRNVDQMTSLGVEQVPLMTLLASSDVVTIHVNKEHGTNVLGSAEISQMKQGAILINNAFPHAVESNALHSALLSKQLRAAFDAAPSDIDFDDIGLGNYVASNAQTAFNTAEANQATSDRVTGSIINLLMAGDDADLKNPEFRKHKKSGGA